MHKTAQSTPSPTENTSDRVLIPLYLTVALLDAGFGSVFVLLAEIRDLLDLSSFGVGLIGGSGFISAFAAQIGLARFADRGHSRRMISYGIAAAVLAMLILVFANSLIAFVLGRMLFGLGEGLVLPAARRIAIGHDPSRAGELLGRLGAAQMTGYLMGPMLGSLMYQLLGLRATFLCTLVMFLLCVPMLSGIPTRARAVAVVSGDRKVIASLLKERRIQALLCAAIGYYGSFGVYAATWAIFLKDLGASQLLIGFSMTIFSLPVIILAPFGGRLAERHGSMRVACLAVAITVPFVALYGFQTNLILLNVLLFFHAASDAIAMPASQLAVAQASGDDLAAGQGLFNAAGLVAGAAVALASGALYDAQGPEILFLAVASLMFVFIGAAVFLARDELVRSSEGKALGAPLEESS